MLMPNPYWTVSALILVAARITVYRSRTLQFRHQDFTIPPLRYQRQLTMRIPLRTALL
jgi:CRISPR-associated Cas5-like protein